MYDISKNIHTIHGDYMRVEILLKKIRKEKEISLEELERRSGISKSHLNYIENGLKEPTITVLICIAKALNINEKELYRIIENGDKNV